jgi:hypothetical protein
MPRFQMSSRNWHEEQCREQPDQVMDPGHWADQAGHDAGQRESGKVVDGPPGSYPPHDEDHGDRGGDRGQHGDELDARAAQPRAHVH